MFDTAVRTQLAIFLGIMGGGSVLIIGIYLLVEHRAERRQKQRARGTTTTADPAADPQATEMVSRENAVGLSE